MSQAFAPIKRRRLSDQVSAQIQVRIASGELRSGDKLPPERELAETFGVSRGAVREALRSLERSGLVSLQAGAPWAWSQRAARRSARAAWYPT